MSLRSLLGRREKSSVDGNCPPLPLIPSRRDIMEDIDTIKKNDAILSLAAILDKNISGRHSVVDSDIKELMEAVQKRKRRESTSSTGSSTPNHNMLNNIPLLSSLKPALSGSTSKGGKNSEKPRGEKEGSASGGETNNQSDRLDFDKLKDFMSTCEHSQELISQMETEFKSLQREISQHQDSKEKAHRKGDVEESSNLL